MQLTKKLKGILPVMVVPMLKGGAPDPEGIYKLVDFLVESGVGGLWVLGSASEDINMSLRHRLQVARLTVEANRGRVPLIIGCGLTAIDDISDYYEKLSDLSMHGAHILPYDTKMGEARLVHLMHTLADRLPFPVWLYHNPKRGRAITEKVIREVKSHPNIHGIKIGGYSLSELTSTMMMRSDDFDVIGAGGGQLFQMMSLGAEAHTTSEASVYPERFVELYQTFISGDTGKARQLQFELIRLSKSYPRTENGEYCAEEKYMLSLRGICQEYVNPLYRLLTESEKSEIRGSLQTHGFSWAK